MQDIPKAAIVGASGFIGSGLVSLFSDEGWTVIGVSRRPRPASGAISAWTTLDQLDVAKMDAIVNLSGEPVDQRWTESTKRKFHASRVGITNQLVSAIEACPVGDRPDVLVNASAVGFYGDRGDEVLEEHAPHGSGYLAELCVEWERAAMKASELGVRVVMPRIGIVLGRDGAAFKKLLMVFRLGIGGRLGSGRQWMPWVHVKDIRSSILHMVMHESFSGPFNATAPHPETNREFTAKFAKALHRPAIFPVPGFALKLGLGGFGGALLAGQRTQTTALEAAGYRFHFPRLEDALRDLTH